MARAVSSMPRGLAIYDFGVTHEAPETHGEDPKAAWEAGLLQQGPGAFHNTADSVRKKRCSGGGAALTCRVDNASPYKLG